MDVRQIVPMLTAKCSVMSMPNIAACPKRHGAYACGIFRRFNQSPLACSPVTWPLRVVKRTQILRDFVRLSLHEPVAIAK